MQIHLMALLAGFILDLCFGDPYGFPHPVRGIGSLISGLEKSIRRWLPKNEAGERTGGILLVLLVLLVTGAVSGGLCLISRLAGPVIHFAVSTIMCYYALAARSLYKESMLVYHTLKKGDVEGARKYVSRIIGRDTTALSEQGIIKAAVETVAENTSDGVIAPIFYLAVGGPVLGWLYKAVNTMDSMVGYKNESYLNFGRGAARLDDAVNFIPSRLSAWFMIAAAAVLQMDVKNAVRIFFRDRRNHKSPNSAQTESVCAGALGVQLAGNAWYFGVLCEKPTIGDACKEVRYQDIKGANLLMYGAAFICLLSAAVFLILSMI